MRTGPGLIILFLLILNISSFSQSRYEAPKFTINLQAEVIIPGPYIQLGEIGQITLSDSNLTKKLSSLILTNAAVPGEAKEITISFIKKRMREIGLELSQINFKGPRVIRIKTLENNILNFFIDQYLAFSELFSVCPKIPNSVITRRFLPKQSPFRTIGDCFVTKNVPRNDSSGCILGETLFSKTANSPVPFAPFSSNCSNYSLNLLSNRARI